jgi:hypothetical protein
MRRTFYASTLALTLAALAAFNSEAGAQTRRGAQAPRTGATATKAPAQRPLSAESVPLPASDALLAVDLDKLFKEVVPRALAGDTARLSQVNADVDAFKTRTGLDVVVGVHGSNMLLPSAHAGGVVELIGPGRWGNFTQDILFRDDGDCRETFFRYRFVDEATPPTAVAQLVNLIVTKRESFRRLTNVF